MALPTFASAKKRTKAEITKELELAMDEKFGTNYNVSELIEKHPNWNARRYLGHRWEVRTGIKDNTYYGETLNEALCRALLEIA